MSSMTPSMMPSMSPEPGMHMSMAHGTAYAGAGFLTVIAIAIVVAAILVGWLEQHRVAAA